MPVALRPSLSSSGIAGEAHSQLAENWSASTTQGSSASSASHSAARGQEAGCNLPENGKSGISGSFCLLGRDGSSYPGSQLSTSSASPLCTRPVVCRNRSTARSDRPNCVASRNRPPVVMQVRSGIGEPSAIAASSYAEFEPMTAPVGELSAPPSADQPKHLTTPSGSKRALGVISMALKNRVWCNPGKGTPSAPRNALAPLTIVRKAPVDMEDILKNEPHLTRNRTSLKSKLSRIVENQAAFNPKPHKAGVTNASGSKLLVFDAEHQSAKGRNSKSVSRNFFPESELVRDRIFAN